MPLYILKVIGSRIQSLRKQYWPTYSDQTITFIMPFYSKIASCFLCQSKISQTFLLWSHLLSLFREMCFTETLPGEEVSERAQYFSFTVPICLLAALLLTLIVALLSGVQGNIREVRFVSLKSHNRT